MTKRIALGAKIVAEPRVIARRDIDHNVHIVVISTPTQWIHAQRAVERRRLSVQEVGGLVDPALPGVGPIRPHCVVFSEQADELGRGLGPKVEVEIYGPK